MKKRILIVVGTRPNFIKVTQFPSIVKGYGNLECKIVHTGQHFDDAMSSVFFKQFNMQPDIFLNIKPGTVVSQMAAIMLELEKTVIDYKPDLIIVPGDVNSTLAAALVANKMNIPLAHLESGLRSYDNTMPEEFNRVLTDNMANYFFVTEQSGYDSLIQEGHKKEAIHFVGNTMIDTMVAFAGQIEQCDILERFELTPKKFVLMTMHRPATVDSAEGLTKLSNLITYITKKYKLVFPIHPRTIKNLEKHGLYDKLKTNKNLVLSGPLDYFAFQKLVKESLLIITDSGGIQEESTFLQIPCLTLRPNTERPVTVTLGTNELIPFDEKLIEDRIQKIENGTNKKGTVPPMWDGRATERIVKVLSGIL
ncbi:MAG TPA: UDP-N-acetylglucosamine 2-epimerase (non-hydrolyzing) [Bacteroidia bacterium]|jgi:UDP-N-acetylglucosamine 2-epimerase (non-hydrolysing)|nr:UDP-N-acetylglucosamine 2-epimerase (non-hydrolyzing) [Bacteroidia bacterium]